MFIFYVYICHIHVFYLPPSCLPFILHILSFQLMGYKKGQFIGYKVATQYSYQFTFKDAGP